MSPSYTASSAGTFATQIAIERDKDGMLPRLFAYTEISLMSDTTKSIGPGQLGSS